MNRPSPVVPIILLLVIIARFTERPLVKIIIPFSIVVLVCGVVGRWLFRRGMVNPRLLRQRFGWAIWLIVGVIALAACVAMFATQPRLRSTYIVGQFDDTKEITAKRG